MKNLCQVDNPAWNLIGRYRDTGTACGAVVSVDVCAVASIVPANVDGTASTIVASSPSDLSDESDDEGNQ